MKVEGKSTPYAEALGEEWHITTNGPIEDDYAAKLNAQLALRPAGTKKIVHHLTSGGGSVYGGYEGYIALQKVGLPIKTIIEGQAQSMATFVALAGDEVEMMDPGTFMIHDPYFSNGVSGRSEDLTKAAKELADIKQTMAERYAMKMKKPLEEAVAMMKAETRLSPRQAKDMGLIDRVVTPHGNILASEDQENFFNKLENTIMNLFKRQAVANTPSAKDFALKTGGSLSVAGDTLAPGMQATFNGQPAEGSYTLADGTTVQATAGNITVVTPPQMPGMPPSEDMAKQLAEVKQQLAALQAASAEKAKAEQAAAEAAKKAEDEEKVKKELAAAQEEIKKLQATAAGNQNPAPQAVAAVRTPSGVRAPVAAEISMTKEFLYENGFEYLTRYPDSPMYGFKGGPVAATVLTENFSYTWPGQLTTEIFYKPQIAAPSLADIFTIDQGIKDRKRYNLVDKLDKILKPYGGCARVFNGAVAITDTLVQTKEFQVGLEWCKDEFTRQLSGLYNILASEWLKTGNKSFDPTGTPIFAMIDKLATEALARDVFRRVSFGASNSSDDDYNQIDGLWDRLIDSSGNTNYCVIRANSPVFGGTSLGIGTLAAGAALTNLEAVYFRSSQILKNMPGKKFYVTRSIWDNYYNSLIGTGAVTEQAFENLQKGITSLTYKGIPLVPVDLWDQFLTESDNPLTGTTRHLILLTVKENHILGVENTADLNKLEGWYERKDRKFYMEGDMKFGYNYLHCDLQTIAY